MLLPCYASISLLFRIQCVLPCPRTIYDTLPTIAPPFVRPSPPSGALLAILGANAPRYLVT